MDSNLSKVRELINDLPDSNPIMIEEGKIIIFVSEDQANKLYISRDVELEMLRANKIILNDNVDRLKKEYDQLSSEDKVVVVTSWQGVKYDDLMVGQRYRIIYRSDAHRVDRVAVMDYMGSMRVNWGLRGSPDDTLVFSARPIAGTQNMPMEWIKSIEFRDKHVTKIEIGRKAN